MIIGVDVGCLGVGDNRLKVGVYRMAWGLLLALSRIDKKNFYQLYSFFPLEKELLSYLGPQFKNIVVKPQKGWFNLWLPWELTKRPVDLFIGLSQSLPPLPKQTKRIAFIHDLTFEKFPQWFPSYKKMSGNSKKAVEKANRVIAVSQATKKDIVDLYHVPEEKITVIYEGFDKRLTKISTLQALERLKKISITRPFFLFVGTFKQSKNIPNIIRAYAECDKKRNYTLVLAGSDFWFDQEITSVIKNLSLGKRVRILGFVDDKILEALYTAAEIFISPSFNEGFGLTFLEAAHFNLPIICSDSGSVTEILGKGALYVNPGKPAEITNAIRKLTTDINLKNRIVKQASQNSSKFFWDRSARKLLTIVSRYEKI